MEKKNSMLKFRTTDCVRSAFVGVLSCMDQEREVYQIPRQAQDLLIVTPVRLQNMTNQELHLARAPSASSSTSSTASSGLVTLPAGPFGPPFGPAVRSSEWVRGGSEFRWFGQGPRCFLVTYIK